MKTEEEVREELDQVRARLKYGEVDDIWVAKALTLEWVLSGHSTKPRVPIVPVK